MAGRGGVGPARRVALVAGAVPLAVMGWRLWSGVYEPDPIAALADESGEWTLRLLLATLAMRPLRRWAGWRWPLAVRRTLGLWTFALATLHLGVYAGLDQYGVWSDIPRDVAERPFVAVGLVAWLLLLPLAVTSTRGWMRRLGGRWQALHRLVYAVAALAVLHQWWIVAPKADLTRPLAYAGVFVLLMALRLPLPARAGRLRAGMGQGVRVTEADPPPLDR